jgi:rubrerythrin
LIVLFFAAAVVFSLFNWRCPACSSYLGKRFNPRFCPSCGAQLHS